MKKRSVICLLLAAVMVLSLCACGAQESTAPASAPAEAEPAPAAADASAAGTVPEGIEVESVERSDVDLQLELLSASVDHFIQPVEDLPWFYTVADLDHDGNLEFIAASQHPDDRSTNLKLWSVGADRSSLIECGVDKDPEESFPDIMTDSADTYHDPVTDTWHYMFYDNVILSDTDVYTSKSAFSLKADYIGYEAFAVQHTEVVNGARTVSYTDAQGNAITAAEYNAAGLSNFANAERSNTSFEWLTEAEARDHARLVESYSVFTGARKATETFPVPAPVAFQYPEGSAAPAPSPTPTPAPAPSPAPTPKPAPAPVSLYITKNPTNENRNIGTTAKFVACANTFESLAWTFVAPNGSTCTPQQFAGLVPGSTVTGTSSTTISVNNVVAGMNGWGAYCTFYYKGQTARTSTAYILVKGVTPAPVTGTYVGDVTSFDSKTVTINCPGVDYFTVSRSICDITGEIHVGAEATLTYIQETAKKPTITHVMITGKDPTQHGDFAGTVYDFGYDTVTINCEGIDYFTVQRSMCEITGDIYVGAPARVYYDAKFARGIHISRVTITGKEPEPQPEYGAMSGVAYHDTAFTVYVVLDNGMGLHIDGSLVMIQGGNEIQGAPCIVYYMGQPSEQSVYKVTIQGYDTQPEPEPEPQPEPEPVISTMKGIAHHDTESGKVRIVLENGLEVHIKTSIVTIKGGTEIENAECVVYYKDALSQDSIYKVEIAGRDPQPDPAPAPLPPIEEVPADAVEENAQPAESNEAPLNSVNEAPAQETAEEQPPESEGENG